jgi:hypothetical protein
MRLPRFECTEAALVFVPRADFKDRPQLEVDNGIAAAELSCVYRGQTFIHLLAYIPNENGFLCYVTRKGQA